MMKNILILILLSFFCMSANSQKVINMEPYGGVYRINCKINGAKMKMVFDTGASSVSISQNIAEYLFDNDFISKNDITGKEQTITASGDIVDNVVINLRDIEIEDIHLNNVKATVISSQNAPLLLGISAINKLGPVTIEGNKLIINQYKNEKLSDSDIDKLFEEADELYNQKKYYAAAEIYSKLQDYLSTKGYDVLIDCYNETNQYDMAVSLFKKWERSDIYTSSTDNEKLILYARAAISCIYTEDYQFRIDLHKKIIALEQKLGGPVDAHNFSVIADTYSKLNDLKKAILYRKKSILQCLSDDNITISDIYNGKEISSYTRLYIGEELYMYALELLQNNHSVEVSHFIMKGAAKCGYQYAIEYCSEFSMDYTSAKYENRYSYLFSSY